MRLLVDGTPVGGTARYRGIQAVDAKSSDDARHMIVLSFCVSVAISAMKRVSSLFHNNLAHYPVLHMRDAHVPIGSRDDARVTESCRRGDKTRVERPCTRWRADVRRLGRRVRFRSHVVEGFRRISPFHLTSSQHGHALWNESERSVRHGDHHGWTDVAGLQL
jgi:hypothetical protein